MRLSDHSAAVVSAEASAAVVSAEASSAEVVTSEAEESVSTVEGVITPERSVVGWKIYIATTTRQNTTATIEVTLESILSIVEPLFLPKKVSAPPAMVPERR